MGCFALAIDNDDACELHLFATNEERDAFLWDYAFDNSGTDAESLEEFKAEYDDDLGDAMQATNDGWHTDDMVSPVDLMAEITKAKAPAGIVEAARLGMAALKLARDCFRSACADRTLERVQLAMSSAKGAVRHAEGKAVR